MRTFPIVALLMLYGCAPDPHVGRVCWNAFLEQEVFVVRTDPITYSRVGVRFKDGTTAWMGRNELSNCQR